MCGIAGIWSPKQDSINSYRIKAMLRPMRNRGPDDEGICLRDAIGFGHRRLKIVDTLAGKQPMLNQAQSIVVVFNGEIYNFKLLQEQLEKKGYVFETNSDTEVILACWHFFKEACVTQLEGMFAFALYDFQSKTLFLARDRLGVKPLYYTWTRQKQFLFASEIKALLAHPEVETNLNTQAIIDYLTLGYIPDPKSPYEAIHQIPPAHWLRIQADGQVELKQYWDINFSHNQSMILSDALSTFSHLFKEAVASRMPTNMPVGAFLSGGLDSTSVVIQMTNLKNTFPVYSLGFQESTYNELPYARRVARLFNLPHHAEVLLPTHYWGIDPILATYDEPFADSSAIATLKISKYAAQHGKVVLSGDGGDEMLGGYRRYRQHLFEQRVKSWVPSTMTAPLSRWLGILTSPLKRATHLLSQDPVAYYFESVSLFKQAELHALLRHDFKKQHQNYRTLDLFYRYQVKGNCPDLLSLLQYLDIKTYLPGDILKKIDRASMRYGLEVRSPFLDHNLITWLATVPRQLKVNQNISKLLLKEWLSPHLSTSFIHRKKQGFCVPLKRWLMQLYAKKLHDLPRDLSYYGIINPYYVEKLVTDMFSRKEDCSAKLWSLLLLERFLFAHSQRSKNIDAIGSMQHVGM